jgi:chromosome segregation ATPase
MAAVLKEKNKELQKAQEEADISLNDVTDSKSIIKEKKENAEIAQKECTQLSASINEEIAQIDFALSDVMPKVEAAKENIKKINPKDIALLKSLLKPPSKVKLAVQGLVILVADSVK